MNPFICNWQLLSPATGDYIQALVNSKLAALTIGLKNLQDVSVVSLSLGNEPPYLELVAFDDAIDFGIDGVEMGTTQGVDVLDSLVGPEGLFAKIKVSYGGSVCGEVKCTVQHTVKLMEGCGIHVGMPITARITDLGIDGFICLNLHRGECKFWMEPQTTGTSPLTNMVVEIAAGSVAGSCDENAPFIDQSYVSNLLNQEISAALNHFVVAPHYISFPIEKKNKI